MGRKFSFSTTFAFLFVVIYAFPFGSSFSSGKCTENQIERMKTAGFSKEEIVALCDASVEQADLARKGKAEKNDPTNTGFITKQNRWGPIVKGLQLGMPYNEAVATLTEQSGNNIHINPRITSSNNIEIFLKDETGRDYLSHQTEGHGVVSDGRLSVSDSGIVTSISLSTRLVNALFNAYDVRTSDFVKAFAEHYGMKEWQQKIKKSDLDSSVRSLASKYGGPPPPSNLTLGILTEEVWMFQGDDFTVKVSRTVGISKPGRLSNMDDKMDYISVRDKRLTIEAPRVTETPSDRMTF